MESSKKNQQNQSIYYQSLPISKKLESRTKFFIIGAFFSAMAVLFMMGALFSYFNKIDDDSLYIVLFSAAVIFGVQAYCAFLPLVYFFKEVVVISNKKKSENWLFEKFLFFTTVFSLLLVFVPFTSILLVYLWAYSQDTSLHYPEFHIDDKKPIVCVNNLILSFSLPGEKEPKKVIRNVTFRLYNGEVFAIIGESGSGKSVLTSVLYGLPGHNALIDSGSIEILGQEVTNWTQTKWEKSGLRGNIVSAVFQNPMTTLNPTQTVGTQIMEGLFVNNIARTRRLAKRVAIAFLKKTKIKNPHKVFKMYPHELSGGMKQRVVLSAILACKARIIILDEPTTALDPTVQAEVLEIIKELRKEFNLSIIFITHDLGVVASLADRIAIMYAGKIIEEGPTREVMLHSQHPYTWGLILSMPDLNKTRKLQSIPGNIPSNLNNIKGDAFAPRNKHALGIDYLKSPPMFKVSEFHYCASWLLSKNGPKYDPPMEIMKRWNRWAKNKPNYVPSSKLASYVFDSKQHQYVGIKTQKDSNEDPR